MDLIHNYDWFIENFRRLTGVDLEKYKRPQMERRLTALCTKRGFHTFGEYLDAASKDARLMDELLDRMTINVSEFFRNQSRWDALAQLFPTLIRNNRIKAWSAACSTGQEPYTLMLLLSKYMPISGVSLLATDIDERALRVAKEGIYSEEELAPIEQELRNKFFRAVTSTQQQAVDEVRARIDFRKHNLLEQPFDTDFDLIVCRNVLIYFTDSAKDILYHKFAQALRPGGMLFVGSTEQIFHAETYRLKQIQPFFYQKL